MTDVYYKGQYVRRLEIAEEVGFVLLKIETSDGAEKTLTCFKQRV